MSGDLEFYSKLWSYHQAIPSQAERGSELDTLCKYVMPELAGTLRRYFPAVDVSVVETAADDTLLRYSDPVTRGKVQLESGAKLWNWLVRIARNLVLDQLRAQLRYSRIQALAITELGGGDARDTDDISERVAELRDELGREGLFTALLVLGVKNTEILAVALDVTHLSWEDQKREVKRWKDRVRLRQRRASGD